MRAQDKRHPDEKTANIIGARISHAALSIRFLEQVLFYTHKKLSASTFLRVQDATYEK